MTRGWLRNRLLKNRSEENRKLFKKKKKSVLLRRKSKKDYFANLNVKNITDNKRLWKSVKPFLS